MRPGVRPRAGSDPFIGPAGNGGNQVEPPHCEAPLLASSVLSHKFLVFQSSQNSPVQGSLRRQYLDIGQEHNAVMADSVISRRARPVRLLAVLQPLPMERPLPADRAYPEALQAALKC
jgi:hypothetical protein